jgi:hypothetical protein
MVMINEIYQYFEIVGCACILGIPKRKFLELFNELKSVGLDSDPFEVTFFKKKKKQRQREEEKMQV